MFSFRSDRLCLDFAATLMHRGTAAPRELLATPDDVAAWCVAAGLLDEPGSFPPAGMDEVYELREAAYVVGRCLAEGLPLPEDAVRVVNEVGTASPPTLTLIRVGERRAHGDLTAVLGALARDTIDLAGGGLADRVRQCQREGCTRLFMDRSRGANRIWCGMAECGNRVNAAAYRRRKSLDGRPRSVDRAR